MVEKESTSPKQPTKRRRYVGVLALLAVVITAVGGFAGWRVVSARNAARHTGQFLTAEVKRDAFIHEVVERGTIDSSHNVEVRCEVRSRSQNGTPILEIVDEGTHVNEGDFLVRLDDSLLQADLVQQQIVVQNSDAAMIQAETVVETSLLARQEYENGTYKQEVEEVQSLVFVAEENLRRAEEYYRYSLRLASKGYVTNIQLEADKFAVDKAKKDLDVANTKQDVLINFTKEKTLKRLDADILAAQAKLRASKESHQIELKQLHTIEEQIAKCTILAPASGQVVYANDSQRNADVLIEEGRLIRERQTIVRLPNPKKMQVVAEINESRIDLVREGMKASIKIDALPGVELVGHVRRVSEYPLPTSSFTSHLKNYATEIEIDVPSGDLRPGMTAQASIMVEELDSALQVPIQAVMERGGRHFCLQADEEHGLQPREIAVGSTNSKFMVVREGLNEADEVVLLPKNHTDGIDWPTLLTQRPAWKDKEEALAQSKKRIKAELAEREERRVTVRKVPVELSAITAGEVPSAPAAR